DRSNGENAATPDGRTMSIAGVTYTKGLGVHSPSDVVFKLDGKCSTFTASAGKDDEKGGGTVVFQVWLEGRPAYTSPVKSANQPAEAVSVDISCASLLELIVDDA